MPRVDATLRLADGRRLEYAEWGVPDGTPVVLLHGSPGSRLLCPDARATVAAGVRLVTFDRPGSGGSDPVEQRALAGLAPDLDALADHLDLATFALVGWSGGGPFAVACAHARPRRVRSLAVVSAPGPLDEVPGGWDALGDYRRPTAETARREPHRSRRAIARHMAPFVADPASFLGSGRGPDGSVLRDRVHGPMLVAQVAEALRPGVDGLAGDLVAAWLEWGFALAEVTVPTHVFHGARDPYNEADARTYAARIPGAALTVWPDCGHLGVVVHWDEVLASVLARGG